MASRQSESPTRSAEPDRGWLAPALLTLLFFGLVLAGALHHEMWRDEHQAWLIARDAGSIGGVFRNLTYDGHPALWHLLLFLLQRFTGNLQAMQVLHVVIATASTGLILFRAPWPLWARALLVFGYFPLYEYGVISRSYALSFLLLLLLCQLWGRESNRPGSNSRPIWTGILLALLAHTNAYGLILSAAFAVFVWLGAREGKSGWPWANRREMIGSILYLLGLGSALASILPPSDGTFPLIRPETLFDIEQLAKVATHIVSSYVYLPDFQSPHFWNSDLIWREPSLGGLLGLAAIVGGLTWWLRKHRSVMWLYLVGTMGLIAGQYGSGLVFARYSGFHVLLVIVCLWLTHSRNRPLIRVEARVRESSWKTRLPRWVVGVVLLVHVQAGLFALGRDLVDEFSASKSAAQYLHEEGWDQWPMVGATDFIISPLASLLHTRIHYVERDEVGSFTIWDAQRKPEYTFPDLLHTVSDVLDQNHDRALVILSRQPSYRQDGIIRPLVASVLPGGIELKLLRHFPPGIEVDEQYYVYQARRGPDSTPSAAPTKPGPGPGRPADDAAGGAAGAAVGGAASDAVGDPAGDVPPGSR